MTLSDFLLARIAEDEAVAQAATAGPWEWRAYPYSDGSAEHDLQSTTAIASPDYYPHPATVVSAHGMHTEGYVDCEPADRDHIARWDPARVLAECEAKRRIVAEHEDLGDGWCRRCRDTLRARKHEAPCDTLRAIALPYADHPDYRETWRP